MRVIINYIPERDKAIKEGVKKILGFFGGHVPYQGPGWGVNPPSRLKKNGFFLRQDVKNIQHALTTFILFKPIFCIVTPSLSTGSIEIIIKKKYKG